MSEAVTVSATTTPEPLLDDKEVARRTGLSCAKLQWLRSRGEGPTYFKLGRSVRYSWREVAAWLEASRVPGATP
jgi:predicted DNA-binding transcriptional regulator AlpA